MFAHFLSTGQKVFLSNVSGFDKFYNTRLSMVGVTGIISSVYGRTVIVNYPNGLNLECDISEVKKSYHIHTFGNDKPLSTPEYMRSW
jgi:hypothetical protein